MPDHSRNVAILGSTGSIGCSTLDVIRASRGRLRAVALSAHQRLGQLVRQAAQYDPRWVIATDATAGAAHDWSGLPRRTEALLGHDRYATWYGAKRSTWLWRPLWVARD
jgi:1-deoxy-D-xylulose-5-phosphate reductoisomerase